MNKWQLVVYKYAEFVKNIQSEMQRSKKICSVKGSSDTPCELGSIYVLRRKQSQWKELREGQII